MSFQWYCVMHAACQSYHKKINHNVCNCVCTDTRMLLSQSATVSLGLIGAGTNNARIAGMLRNLSSYYYKDASLLFCVRIDPLPQVLLRFFCTF